MGGFSFWLLFKTTKKGTLKQDTAILKGNYKEVVDILGDRILISRERESEREGDKASERERDRDRER